jgi:hypothetical protein
MTVLVLWLTCSVVVFAQEGKPSAMTKDLSGYWMINGGHTFGTPAPPLTSEGKKAMEGRIPDSVNRLPGNAPWYQCNPMGFPRIVMDSEPVEFIHMNERLLQRFQWENTIRELWLDGRAVPSGDNLENLGPTWYGHSVGKWEGNTLVVSTVGLDERAWLDNPGFPKSFYARLEERFTPIDADTIELQLTLVDPKFYTAPWVSAKKLYKRMPVSDFTYFGWTGLYSGITDAICAPMNEVDDYNKRIRNPAAGIGPEGATGRPD